MLLQLWGTGRQNLLPLLPIELELLVLEGRSLILVVGWRSAGAGVKDRPCASSLESCWVE